MVSNTNSQKGTIVNFDLTPEDIARQTDALIQESKKVQDKVAAVVSPTFASVIVPLATCENNQYANINVIKFSQNVSTNKAVRDASTEAEKKLEAFKIESEMREDVYKVVRAVYDNDAEMSKLEGEERRIVEKMELGFRRSGLALDKSQRDHLASIKTELSELCIKFNRNINEGDGKATFTREELEGLPGSYFEDRPTEVVDGIEKYIVTTKYPDCFPVMESAKHELTRKKLWLVNGTRCPENVPILQEVIGLRLEIARMLGYKTHAEFELEVKMAKTPGAVDEFIMDLRQRLDVLADKELEEIQAFKRADKKAAGETYEGLFSWDYKYYTKMLKERKHSIDDEEVKKYFPVKKVVRGVLDFYQKIFSLKFVKVDDPAVWHPDVELYEVWEAATEDIFIGHFYLDLYPREGKYNHAAVWPIRPRFEKPDGSHEYPVSAMVANFPKPTSSAPALLTHNNAITFLHEMGHVLHEICSVTKYGRFHGTNTELDFVEAPSQMLENWGWEPSVLRQLTCHYQTGEPIPEEMVQSLVAAKNEGAGLGNLFRVFFAMFDMAIHNSDEEGNIDIKGTYSSLYEDVVHLKYGDGSHDVCGGAATLDHLTGGYDAGLYSYLWSRAFSADIYASRFKKEGVANPQTGMDYRSQILRPGFSRDGMESLEAFLGRKPNNKAFLKSLGL